VKLSISARLLLNFKIFLHCIRVVKIVKNSSFKECLSLLQRNDFNFKSNPYMSENYLSKKINFYNNLIFSNNCFTKSLCFYTFFNSEKSISLNIGVKKSMEKDFESHSWIEINDFPINEPSDLITYRLIFKTIR
jgi:hypothetical protein